MSALKTDATPGRWSWLRSNILNEERCSQTAFQEPITLGMTLSNDALMAQRKMFVRAVSNAESLFRLVRGSVDEWRQAIADMQAVRDTATEAALKELVSSWISLGQLLVGVADACHARGPVLCNNRCLRPILACLDEAKHIFRRLEQVQDPFEQASRELASVLQDLKQGAKPRSSPRLDELAKQAVQIQKTDTEDENTWADRLTDQIVSAGDY